MLFCTLVMVMDYLLKRAKYTRWKVGARCHVYCHVYEDDLSKKYDIFGVFYCVKSIWFESVLRSRSRSVTAF